MDPRPRDADEPVAETPRPTASVRVTASGSPRDPSAPLGRLGVGSVLARTLRIFGSGFVPFAAMSLFLHAPLFAYTAWVYAVRPETPEAWATLERREEVWLVLQFFLSILTAQVLAGPVTYGVVERLRGRVPTFWACVRTGLVRLPRVVGAVLLLVVYAAVFLFGVFVVLKGPIRGLQESGETGSLVSTAALLLVLLAFLGRFWVGIPAAVVEDVGPRGALRRSRALTRGNVGKIWLVTVLLLAINLGIRRAVAELTPHDFDGVRLGNFGQILIPALIVGPLGGIAAAVGYHDLRLTAEGVDTETLARVFE